MGAECASRCLSLTEHETRNTPRCFLQATSSFSASHRMGLDYLGYNQGSRPTGCRRVRSHSRVRQLAACGKPWCHACTAVPTGGVPFALGRGGSGEIAHTASARTVRVSMTQSLPLLWGFQWLSTTGGEDSGYKEHSFGESPLTVFCFC